MPKGHFLEKILESVKTSLFATGVVLFTCFAAFAAGISVPENSHLNINSGKLYVELTPRGSIANAGVIKVTTGVIRLNGDWTTTGNGYFDHGSSSVYLSALTIPQVITPGLVEVDGFYNLVHEAGADVQIGTAEPGGTPNPLNIAGSLYNLAGTFKASGAAINLTGNWINTSPANPSFDSEDGQVNLVGTDQELQGSTTFYDLTKHITDAASYQLTFPSGEEQTIEHKLVLRGYGAEPNLLALRKSAGADLAELTLLPGGAQDIRYVDVRDNDARGGITLVARSSPNHIDEDIYQNFNWLFGAVEVTWTGSVGHEWDNPFNWNIGIVPETQDRVIIPGGCDHYPILEENITVASMDLQPGGSIFLDEHNLTLQQVTIEGVTSGGTLTNAGTIVLTGRERVIARELIDTGAFKYVGRENGFLDTPISNNFIINGATLSTYHSLIVEETNTALNPDRFRISASLVVQEDAVFTAGQVAFDSITPGMTLQVNGVMRVDGGAFDGTYGHLDLSSFDMSAGYFLAPSSVYMFRISGDFRHTAGSFNHNNGTLELDGINQRMTGSTEFFRLSKQLPANPVQSYTLTLKNGDTFTVHDRLVLTGIDQIEGDPDDPFKRLNIVSLVPGEYAHVRLLPGAIQQIRNVNVAWNHAGVDPDHVTLVARGSSRESVPGSTVHWAFGSASFRWDGSLSTAWEVADNWDLGLVPEVDDTVYLRDHDENNGDAQILLQPILSGDVSLGDMYVRDTGAALTLSGHALEVANTFSNDGTIYLQGNESINIAAMDIDSGTFVYYGDGVSPSITITGGGRPTTFFNMRIEDPSAGDPSIFLAAVDLAVYGSLSISGAGLDAGGISLDIQKDFIMTGGILTAPDGDNFMSVGRNFTHTLGTFNANGGIVIFDGTAGHENEQIVTGTTTFFKFRKRVTDNPTQIHRIIFDSTGEQIVVSELDLGGAEGNPLQIRSNSTADPVVPAKLSLSPGGAQRIDHVDVKDSDASGGGTGVMLVARPTSVNGFNNTNWQFDTPNITWTGAYSSYWGDVRNWDLGLVPITGDDVTIPAVATPPYLSYLLPTPPPAPTVPAAASLRNLTLETDAALYLDGYGLTVTHVFSNNGNIHLQGNEPLAITTPDADHGTFTYTGTAPPSGITFNNLTGDLVYHHLVIDAAAGNILTPARDLVVNGDLTLSGEGTLDVSAEGFVLTVAGDMFLTAGLLDAEDGSIALTGSMTLNGAALSAPDEGGSFIVGGGWTNISGSFLPNNGRVTFSGPGDAVIRGDTVFHDLRIVSASVPEIDKTVYFEQGSNQTVNGELDLAGNETKKLVLRSTAEIEAPGPSRIWMLTVASGSPVVSNLDVKDSTAILPAPGARDYILALNSVDSLNNTHWRFLMLDIITPSTGRTVGVTPVVIGHGIPGEVVTLLDQTLAVIATARADANGNFRVPVGVDAAHQDTVTKFLLDVSTDTGDRQIIPRYDIYTGNPSVITVVAAPTLDQVPQISLPVDGEHLVSNTPTIIGQGKENEDVYVVASDREGSLLLTLPPDAYAGDGDVDPGVGGIGPFSVTLTRELPRGYNYVSVIVNGVSSPIFTYIVNSIHGQVFDSGSNHPLLNARVSVLKEDGSLAAPPDIGATDVNPAITPEDGFFTFLIAEGSFKLKVESQGYEFPTKLSDAELPAGHSIITGSRGEVFPVGANDVRRMDIPMDATPYLFKIEKTANKAEAKVGEVVTYTVTIESLIDSNTITLAKLVDVIPPGFKFMEGRAQLDGLPLADPSGSRPLWFNVGDFAPRQKKTLRYQLVIGSGVAPGAYENAASMQYQNGMTVSNRATETVTIVLDPLFDAGTVFGKVFFDWNENGRQDDPDFVYEDRQEIIEGPVANVKLAMEDGTLITADANGQFHVPALLPGRHLLRIDERSLPPGAYLTTDKVQVVDVTAGSIIKVNFGVNIDNTQVVGKDILFFQKEVVCEQKQEQPKPRLNVDVFNTDVLLHNDTVIEQIEFRIFTNYAPFFMSWQMDVIDADTKKTVRSFDGTRYNVFDPIYWDGRDKDGRYLRSDRKYAYVLRVKDDKGRWDETSEQALSLKIATDAEMTERQRQRSDKEKKDEASSRAREYRAFLVALASGDALKTQRIDVRGETLVLTPSTVDVRQVRVLKNGELFVDVPALERRGLTARELLEGGSSDQAVPMEVILPDGDYELEVVSAEGAESSFVQTDIASAAGKGVVEPLAAKTARYKKPIKVGEDYMMFVAMGDGKVGYNMNKGNIEPVQQDETYSKGFYSDGKMAYYLKGKIKGKYIVTSSFDTERRSKEALRTFKDEEYYPVYGDASTIDYDATDTEGPLYLSVEWDKSRAIWGNYAVAFNDVEFANYTRSLYGGKIDYRTVASTEYGESKTNVVLFHAEVQRRAAHNELLGTGGSLYYLKHADVVQGTDKVRLEVRDAVTGLVTATTQMKEGVDYEMDYGNGRMLFWKPVSMSADSSTLSSNGVLNGNPVYVIADYEYFVQDKLAEATRGARVTQAVAENAVAGVTYVSETQADHDYALKGADVTLHLGKDAAVKAEYAETSSDAQNNFISTDGGITFTELASSDNAGGKAYGISQDARLFDRVGLKSYYKWIGDGFSTGGTTSQQGKELKGIAMTFDVTPVTRLTASRDIQRLIERGNLQTAVQVGAKETITTLVQVVHDARRLRLTEEFKSVETRGAEGVKTTSENSMTAAAQAEYALNARTDLLFRHQAALAGVFDQLTTVGIRRQLTDKLSVNLEESFGAGATATKIGATANVTPKLALNTDYTMGVSKTGEKTQTIALGGTGQINDKTSLRATTSMTSAGAGAQQQGTVALTAGTKVDENTDIGLSAQVTDSTSAAETKGLALTGVRKGQEGRETTGAVRIDDTSTGERRTVITAGEKGRIAADSQIATERSFAFGPTTQEQADTYRITKVNKEGRSFETSYARKLSTAQASRSDSNIFGLTGDVNDRVALQASLERGKVLNLDGTVYDRIALAGGVGYVDKDPETGKTRFQSSTKAELRLDDGNTDTQQYVLYHSAEGKLNEQTTLRGKFSYSTTRNMATKKSQAGYTEIMLGGAYRPVSSDRVNVFGEYTYKENKGPLDQANAADIEETKMHVLSAGAAYELNDKWELVERLALRIMEEKVSGFEFAKTHTWLLINRANYSLNQDWKIGAEYRILTVQEAKDQKRGLLLEAVHSINDNVELGIGYNFTDFMDDLTNLSYTVQGPYIRMTGKLYDQSPEERARAKARWMDRRVEIYAWKMVKKEFIRKDSEIVLELNQMYQMAQIARELGKYEDSRRIYKDIILVTQLMYEEAAQFVRGHIAFEEQVFNAYQRAREYYDKGELWQARKLWEKIVEEASKAVLE